MSSSGSYRVLGLSPHATRDEIKQAFRAMALRWHPDRNPADAENATQCFLEVQHAYRTLMRERFTQPSPTSQRTKSASTYQTYQTGSSNSGSTSTLSSLIHVSSSSMDSLVTPASTVGSNMSSCKCHPSGGPQWQNGKSPTVVPHPSQSSLNDRSQHPVVSPSGLPRTRHSAENLRLCSKEWTNHAAPSFPNLRTAKVSKESRLFTIIPPARKQFPLPLATSSRDFYLLHGLLQTVSLRCFGIGPSKEWIYGLALSLEDLLKGKLCSFSLSRVLVSGETKKVVLEVEIPPGCREGTRILCRGVGHEQKDGTRQDIVFIIEELNHDHFLRVCNDLVLDVKIPFGDYLRNQNGDFVVEGLDRRKHVFHIEYDTMLTGEYVIRGSGMPIRHQGQVIGRGNLIVQWEMIPQRPKVFNFMKRFMHFRR